MNIYILILTIFALLIPEVFGVDLDENPDSYRSFRLNFRDWSSGIEVNLIYGKNETDSLGFGQISIHGPGDSTPVSTIKISKEEIRKLHLKIKSISNTFSLRDDPDQAAFEKRIDQGQPIMFSMEVGTAEQAVKFLCSPRDSKNFTEIGECFTSVIEMFPHEWKIVGKPPKYRITL